MVGTATPNFDRIGDPASPGTDPVQWVCLSLARTKGFMSHAIHPRGVVDTVCISYERVFEQPIDEAFDWLTDYRDDDAERAGAIIQDRNVLERTEEEIVLEGELKTLGRRLQGRARVELETADHRWVAHLEDRKGRPAGRYEYELDEHPDGCRLTVDYHVAAPRLRDKLMLWATRPLARREIDTMWDGFADAMTMEADTGAIEGNTDADDAAGSTAEVGEQAASQ